MIAAPNPHHLHLLLIPITTTTIITTTTTIIITTTTTIITTIIIIILAQIWLQEFHLWRLLSLREALELEELRLHLRPATQGIEEDREYISGINTRISHLHLLPRLLLPLPHIVLLLAILLSHHMHHIILLTILLAHHMHHIILLAILLDHHHIINCAHLPPFLQPSLV